MGGPTTPPLTPVELRVLHMLRARVPGLAWDPRRVVLCVRDYERHIDVEEVAARCADWMMSGEAKRVRDGPATLRSFLARAKQEAPPAPKDLPEHLRAYERLANSSAPSRTHRAA